MTRGNQREKAREKTGQERSRSQHALWLALQTSNSIVARSPFHGLAGWSARELQLSQSYRFLHIGADPQGTPNPTLSSSLQYQHLHRIDFATVRLKQQDESSQQACITSLDMYLHKRIQLPSCLSQALTALRQCRIGLSTTESCQAMHFYQHISSCPEKILHCAHWDLQAEASSGT